MIYKYGDALALEFTGYNWLELGKFLELNEMQAVDKTSDIPMLIDFIQHSVAGYQLSPGHCLVRKYPSRRAMPFRNKEEAGKWIQNNKIWVSSTPCIVETDEHVIRAFQYNYTNDILAVVDYLKDWVHRPSTPDANGWSTYFLYNPHDINSGRHISRGDWILIYIDPHSETSVRVLHDNDFQLSYDQIGNTIIPRKTWDDKLQMELDRILKDSVPFPEIIIQQFPKFSRINSVCEIVGGFAPSYRYDTTFRGLASLGQHCRIVTSTKKYAAFQYTSLDALNAITVLYPMVKFVEEPDIMYDNRAVISILVHNLSGGCIKHTEWIIFEPSTPDNPKFTIVSNNEFQRDYKISD